MVLIRTRTLQLNAFDAIADITSYGIDRRRIRLSLTLHCLSRRRGEVAARRIPRFLWNRRRMFRRRSLPCGRSWEAIANSPSLLPWIWAGSVLLRMRTVLWFYTPGRHTFVVFLVAGAPQQYSGKPGYPACCDLPCLCATRDWRRSLGRRTLRGRYSGRNCWASREIRGLRDKGLSSGVVTRRRIACPGRTAGFPSRHFDVKNKGG